MNLYEVTISGTCQQVQASKPEVALNNALRRLKYGDNNIMLNNVLKEQHSIHLDIDIKNVGKMIQIQRQNNRYDRKYILVSNWIGHDERDGWKACKDVKNAVIDRANEIREILKVLYDFGDSMVWDGCWRGMADQLVDEWEPRLKEINETTMATVNQIINDNRILINKLNKGKA